MDKQLDVSTVKLGNKELFGCSYFVRALVDENMNVTSEITTYIPGPSDGLPLLVEIGLTDLPNGTPRDDRPASNSCHNFLEIRHFRCGILVANHYMVLD